MRRQLRELLAVIGEADPRHGAPVIGGSGHYRVRLSNGASVTLPSSASDWRTAENVRRDVRRALRGSR